MNIIDAPDLFVESLIDDTFDDRLTWSTLELNVGTKHTTIIDVPTTTKYLKVELFEIPTISTGKWEKSSSSFLKIEFHVGYKNRIEFESINKKDHPERIIRLLQAIKRQKDSKIVNNY